MMVNWFIQSKHIICLIYSIWILTVNHIKQGVRYKTTNLQCIGVAHRYLLIFPRNLFENSVGWNFLWENVHHQLVTVKKSKFQIREKSVHFSNILFIFKTFPKVQYMSFSETNQIIEISRVQLEILNSFFFPFYCLSKLIHLHNR